MLNQVHFENYKALRNVTVDLERLTVFVGPNGSGKTSILEAVFDFAQLGVRNKREVFSKDHPFSGCYRTGASEPMRLKGASPSRNRSFDISPSDFDDGKPPGRKVPQDRPTLSELAEGMRPGDRLESNPEERELARGTVFLRLDVARVSAPSYSDLPVPTVGDDGAGTASALAFLKLNHEDHFRELLDELRRIVPAVRDIRFSRAPIRRPEIQLVGVGDKQVPVELSREVWGETLIFDTNSGHGIPAQFMSEGTLLATGILTVIATMGSGGLVLLDDIDRALHPKAQVELVAVLRSLLDQRPDFQLLATSHSPYLLDSFKPEEVRITVLNDEGDVVVAPLTSHPDFERWKDIMTAGEFWTSVGESWVASRVAGEPQP